MSTLLFIFNLKCINISSIMLTNLIMKTVDIFYPPEGQAKTRTNFRAMMKTSLIILLGNASICPIPIYGKIVYKQRHEEGHRNLHKKNC